MNTKISQLPAVSAISGCALLPMVQSGANYTVTPGQLFASNASAIINGLGDSITAQNSYQQANVDISALPVWQPNTAYAKGTVVKNGGFPYYCNTAGTSAASGGPVAFSGVITDNTATWIYYSPQITRSGTSYLVWAERFSNGRLNFDMSAAYTGLRSSLLKVIVVNGGSNYASPTITFSPSNNGITGTVQTSAGVITGVTITNPGFISAGNPTYNITDTSGSGAVFSLVYNNSGSFGVSGCKIGDMIARLPDCVASRVDIFAVHGGTNNITDITSKASAQSIYALITDGLRTIYETLIAAGKKVIAIPITPRNGLTVPQNATLLAVNRWIVSYVRKMNHANPLGMACIALADSTGFYTDGASATHSPIGGAGGIAGAMTVDGLHPSPRGAMYTGLAVARAAQVFVGEYAVYASRAYSMYDGYDADINPGGNLLEGLPWQASYTYTYLGQCVSNGGNLYRLKTIGTSASSGGPTGTSSTINDGGAVWAHLRPAGMSVFASGTSGTNTAATGIAYSGLLATGYTLYRQSGTASGTITESIESPWSNGQAGQRQVITFSLGSGGASEVWDLRALSATYNLYGIQPSDLGTAYYFMEAEIELSSVANLLYIDLNGFADATISFASHDGQNSTGIGYHMMGSANEMLDLPQKLYLRTQPILLPSNLAQCQADMLFAFDTSGGAGSATATIKINYIGLRKAYVA